MIYFLPGWDENTASSRLRVWKVQPFIKDSVIGVPEKYEKGDVLIIQKAPYRDEMKKAQSQGAKVIYDIDDYYWEKSEFRLMTHDADLITVDTEEKKRMLVGKVVVIPDSLDWDGTKKQAYREDEKQLIVGWTGYGNNAHYLNPIELPKTMMLRFISTPDWMYHYKTKDVQSRPWSLEMVDKYLAECDLGIYYLPDGDFEKCKGMHKLLKNWAIGLPTYTSPMPDYVKAMTEAGVGEKYLVKKVEDWKNLSIIGFDEKCREYAMQFTPEKMALLWEQTIKSLL